MEDLPSLGQNSLLRAKTKLKDSDVAPENESMHYGATTDMINWKFKFKNGSIVSESEIGIKNSSLTMFEVTKLAMWSLWLNCTRFNLPYLIIELIIYTLIGKYYIPLSYIIFLVSTYLLIIGCEASFFYYFYLKVKNLESANEKFKIYKAKSNTTWRKLKFDQIRVGDLILLNEGAVAPADILIVDTSDTHFSEQICSINEGRVTGCNKMTIKRAIKSLRSKTSDKNPHEVLKEVLPLLEGQLDYEAPSNHYGDFTGTFKLNNDPQTSRITLRSVLFCGTQLHTKWVMGIVMYNGKNTKILQMNMLRWTWFQRLRKETKISKVGLIINWFFVIYIVIGVITTLLLMVQMQDTRSQTLSRFIESSIINSQSLRRVSKVLVVWQGSLVFVPHLIVLVYEVVCFTFGIYIQRKIPNETKEILKAAVSKIHLSDFPIKRRNSRKKSSQKLRDSVEIDSDSKGGEAINFTGLSNQTSQRQFIDSVKKTHRYSFNGNPEASSPDRKTSLNVTGMSTTNQGSRKFSTKFVVGNDKEVSIKVINYEALPDLGNISHVVFDKTDTLTLNTMHVHQIVTVNQIYEIENEQNIKEYMEQFDLNPKDFEFESDESNDTFKDREIEYSEKSQEYESEILGEYCARVQDETQELIYPISSAPLIDLNKYAIEAPESQRSYPNSDGSGNIKVKSHKSSQNTQGVTIKTKKDKTTDASDSFLELDNLEQLFKKTFRHDLIRKEGTNSNSSNSDSNDLSSPMNPNRAGRGGTIINYYRPPQVKFNNERIRCDRYLVNDMKNQESSLEELCLYMCLLHVNEYGAMLSDSKYMRAEDKAMFDVMRSLGFSLGKKSKIVDFKAEKTMTSNQGPQKNSLNIMRYTINGINNIKASYRVYANNIYSEKRKIKSSIISVEGETKAYYLVAMGNEKHMKNILNKNMPERESNLLKVLIAKQKQKGLKVILLAKKSMTEGEMLEYTKQYAKISNSARDQIDDLEDLALQMETDMDFLGCFGMRDTIRDDAENVLFNLKKINMPISIMSGDELENCLNVVQKLQICPINIRNSSTFHALRGSQEKTIKLEMKRIFEGVYDLIQGENYATIEGMIKGAEKDDAKLSESAIHTSSFRQLGDEFNHKDDEERVYETSQESTTKRLKKPLLISGISVERIMKSKLLTLQLRGILRLSSSVIAYDLAPNHKAFLVEQIRKGGEIVMAVGDGFNDLGMLTCANIGIQIASREVPLIFGDIIIPDLSQIPPLLFDYGFRLQKNLLMVYILIINVVTFNMVYPQIALLGNYGTLSFHLNFNSDFSISAIFVISAIFALVNRPYTEELTTCMPSLYIENKLFLKSIFKILVGAFAWGALEAVFLVACILLFLTKDNTLSGETTTSSINFLFYLIVVSILTIAKPIIMLSQKEYLTFAQVFLPGILIYFLVFIIQNFESDYSLDGQPKFYRTFFFGIIFLIGFYLYFTVYIYKYLTLKYIQPGARQIPGYINRIDASYYDRRNRLTWEMANSHMAEQLLRSEYKERPFYLRMIDEVKKPFKGLPITDSSLQKIINIDFHNSDMGLTAFTNWIVDQAERRRFDMFMKKSMNMVDLKRVMTFLVIASVVEYLISIFTKNYRYPLLLGSTLPYIIVIFSGLLVIFYWKPKLVYKSSFGTSFLISRSWADNFD